MAEKYKVSHTEVDEVNGHEWAHMLYKQETQQTDNAAFDRVMEFYTANKDRTCDWYTIATGRPCRGQTSIPAFNDGPLNACLFLGCNRWKGRETGHICIALANYDIPTKLQIWGKERVQVHEDILEAISFEWDATSTDEEAPGI